jgi:UDP-N-acetyl-D-glucosamine dehydrogenase
MTTCINTVSLFSELKTRIDSRQARIGVIGLGYVGLPLALLYTEANFRVTGFDIDQNKRNAMKGIHAGNIVRC